MPVHDAAYIHTPDQQSNMPFIDAVALIRFS